MNGTHKLFCRTCKQDLKHSGSTNFFDTMTLRPDGTFSLDTSEWYCGCDLAVEATADYACDHALIELNPNKD